MKPILRSRFSRGPGLSCASARAACIGNTDASAAPAVVAPTRWMNSRRPRRPPSTASSTVRSTASASPVSASRLDSSRSPRPALRPSRPPRPSRGAVNLTAEHTNGARAGRHCPESARPHCRASTDRAIGVPAWNGVPASNLCENLARGPAPIAAHEGGTPALLPNSSASRLPQRVARCYGRWETPSMKPARC